MDAVETPGPLTRILTRLAIDGDGRLRSMRLLAIAFLAGLLVAIGTTAAIVVADAGSPSTLSIWVVVSFLGVKLPLLGLFWWILGRRQREDTLTDDELRLMMARLESSAEAALRTPDARDRLEILREEARFVHDHASETLTYQAHALVERVDALVRAAGSTDGGAAQQLSERRA